MTESLEKLRGLINSWPHDYRYMPESRGGGVEQRPHSEYCRRCELEALVDSLCEDAAVEGAEERMRHHDADLADRLVTAMIHWGEQYYAGMGVMDILNAAANVMRAELEKP